MTRKLFWEKPYETQFKAKIVSIKEDGIILDQTLFYPFSGGQLSDRGFLRIQDNKFKVEKVTIDGDEIIHHISANFQNKVKLENEVIGELDWEYRYGLMKAHSSQHIFSAVIKEKFGINTIKAYLNFEDVSLSLSKNISYNQLKSALEEINEICTLKNLETEVKLIHPEEVEASTHGTRGEMPMKKEIRIVNIENLDSVYCGGTHVNNSSEIGPLFVYEFKKGREIKYYVGNKAIKMLSYQNLGIVDLASFFNLPIDNIFPILKDQILKLREKNLNLVNKILELIKNNPIITSKGLKLGILNIDLEYKILSKKFSEFPPNYILLIRRNPKSFILFSNDENFKANKFLELLTKKYGGKGGGSTRSAQVTLEHEPQDLISEIEKSL